MSSSLNNIYAFLTRFVIPVKDASADNSGLHEKM
ncbi:hypothetical protein FORC89_p137 (plasmid) [Salmonella sp. FORC89]|nr:not available [Salmonella enterica]UWN40265.1 hypothetical protein FORC89_p137 [Salmonella sp. FORC89]WIW81023.1 hypothetical protein [Salmonella sp.]